MTSRASLSQANGLPDHSRDETEGSLQESHLHLLCFHSRCCVTFSTLMNLAGPQIPQLLHGRQQASLVRLLGILEKMYVSVSDLSRYSINIYQPFLSFYTFCLLTLLPFLLPRFPFILSLLPLQNNCSSAWWVTPIPYFVEESVNLRYELHFFGQAEMGASHGRCKSQCWYSWELSQFLTPPQVCVYLFRECV